MSRELGTYRLRHDIVLETRAADGGGVVDEVLKPAGTMVVLRRPKAKDLKVFDSQSGDIASAMVLLERISTLDPVEVDNLDAEDMAELGNLLARFAPNGPPTGQT